MEQRLLRLQAEVADLLRHARGAAAAGGAGSTSSAAAAAAAAALAAAQFAAAPPPALGAPPCLEGVPWPAGLAGALAAGSPMAGLQGLQLPTPTLSLANALAAHMASPWPLAHPLAAGLAAAATALPAPGTRLPAELAAAMPPNLAGTGLPTEFFQYTPRSAVIGVGQLIELWPPVPLMLSSMVFAVSPELPKGLSLDERVGLIHGRAQVTSNGATPYFVTACALGDERVVVKVAVVRLKVVEMQSLGPPTSSLSDLMLAAAMSAQHGGCHE